MSTMATLATMLFPDTPLLLLLVSSLLVCTVIISARNEWAWVSIWQYWLWSIQEGGGVQIKIERYLNQHQKLLTFELMATC
jgi:hypothetical protein